MTQNTGGYTGGRSAIYAQTDLVIPPCLQRGYDTAVEFTNEMAMNGGHRGLLLLFGREKKISRVLSSRLNGTLTQKYSRHNPVLYSEILQELYGEMGELDGGIAFDPKGNLIGTEVYVQRVAEDGFEGVMGEVMRRKGRNSDGASTRHLAAAFASGRGVPAIAVSGEVGTVMAFMGGGLVDGLYFDPRISGYDGMGVLE